MVGASGILAPLVAALAREGHTVLGVSRHPAHAQTADVIMVAADTTTVAGARRTARAGPFSQAVVYGPAVSGPSLAELLRQVTGPGVLILTSGAADPAVARDVARIPDQRRPRPGDGVLLLGWTAQTGWHTPEEVSAAALSALRDGGDHVLGTVRPWRDRPRTI